MIQKVGSFFYMTLFYTSCHPDIQIALVQQLFVPIERIFSRLNKVWVEQSYMASRVRAG